MLNHKLFIFLILPLFLLIPSEAKMKLSKTMHQDIEKKYEQSKMKQKKTQWSPCSIRRTGYAFKLHN